MNFKISAVKYFKDTTTGEDQTEAIKGTRGKFETCMKFVSKTIGTEFNYSELENIAMSFLTNKGSNYDFSVNQNTNGEDWYIFTLERTDGK